MIAVRWRAPVAWALLIEVLVLWPNPPDVPQGWNLFWSDFVQTDKLVHAFLFAVLAVLIVRVLIVAARPWWLSFAASTAFGAFTEIQQHFIPSRAMEFGDFLADTAGAVVGLVAFIAFIALARSRRELSR